MVNFGEVLQFNSFLFACGIIMLDSSVGKREVEDSIWFYLYR